MHTLNMRVFLLSRGSLNTCLGYKGATSNVIEFGVILLIQMMMFS